MELSGGGRMGGAGRLAVMIRASGDRRLWKKTTGDPLDPWIAVRLERPCEQAAWAETFGGNLVGGNSD